MPHLDLDQDHLVGVGASGHGEPGDVSFRARADDGDAPPESVLIRVRDGINLAELFGAALRRDGSTKGSSNPKSAAEAAATTRKQGAPRADSSRRSMAAAVIGVLPAAGKVVVAKERRARAPGRVVAARAWRRPGAGSARVFASEAVGGSEPVSPKVSCFGAVLPETRVAAAPPGTTREGEDERGEGCWASVVAALCGLCCSCSSGPREGEPGTGESDAKTTAAEPPFVAVLSPPMPVAGLGDVKRLASRRWTTETMAAEGRGGLV